MAARPLDPIICSSISRYHTSNGRCFFENDCIMPYPADKRKGAYCISQIALSHFTPHVGAAVGGGRGVEMQLEGAAEVLRGRETQRLGDIRDADRLVLEKPLRFLHPHAQDALLHRRADDLGERRVHRRVRTLHEAADGVKGKRIVYNRQLCKVTS